MRPFIDLKWFYGRDRTSKYPKISIKTMLECSNNTKNAGLNLIRDNNSIDLGHEIRFATTYKAERIIQLMSNFITFLSRIKRSPCKKLSGDCHVEIFNNLTPIEVFMRPFFRCI